MVLHIAPGKTWPAIFSIEEFQTEGHFQLGVSAETTCPPAASADQVGKDGTIQDWLATEYTKAIRAILASSLMEANSMP